MEAPAIETDDVELLPGYRIHPTTGAWHTLPWPARLDELPQSLGPGLIAWAEWRTDKPGLTHYLTGEPWRFTVGQRRFLHLWYAYDDEGRFTFRSGVKRGAKGTGKDPFGAAVCNLELLGPSQLVRDADGRWTGQAHKLPLVQIASNSEAQSKDMLRVMNALLGPEAREQYGVDAGETRTIVAGGGRAEVLTSSEKSSEGDPATFIALNESHHMTKASGGHAIAEVARRNVAKSPAWIQARLLEFTNAHVQGLDSVAERSFIAWQAQQATPELKSDILYDSIEADPRIDTADPDEIMIGLQQAYSDSPWSDLPRLRDEAMDLRTSPGDTVRFYLNGLGTAEDAWVVPGNFDAGARSELTVEPRDRIAMFLDCSKSDDATAFMGCRLEDGFNFVIDVWQRPHGDRGTGWLAPRDVVDAKVREAMALYRVMWFGVDPSPAEDEETESNYWMPLIDTWHQDFRKLLPNWATPGAPGATGHAVLYDMRRSARGGKERVQATTEMAELLAARIDEEHDLIHDGDPRLRTHVHNARRRPNAFGIGIGKESRSSKKKIDLAFAMVGANVGRRVALNSGKDDKKRTGVVW